MATLWINDIYNNKEHTIKELKIDYAKNQKIILKREVSRVINYIKYEKKLHKNSSQKDIKTLQNEILDVARQIKFGKNGYIFIYRNKYIIHKNKLSFKNKNLINFKDSDSKSFVMKLISVARSPKPSFVNYIRYQPNTDISTKKIGYAENISDWNWIIGGVFANNIDKVIKQKQIEFTKEIHKKILKITILFIIILIFISYLLYKQTIKIKKSFDQFHKFLQSAHKKTDKIKLSDINFEEFLYLAKDVNDMIGKRVKIQKELSEKNNALSETIDNLQTILDSTIEMIIFSKDGKLLDVNKATIDIMGYKNKSEVIGKYLFDFLPKKEIPKVTEGIKSKKEVSYELTMLKNNGMPIHILARGKDIYRKGEVVRMSTLVDLTQIKQRDEAIAASKAKSKFLANMSHEIRTPLNVIIGFIELLQEKERDKKKLNYLNTITNSSKNLLNIINDILDFSKIESGKFNIECIDFNPIDEFVLTQKLFKTKCKKKEISLHTKFTNLPHSLNGDILRIKQIINNLLSNAIKFTPDNKNIYLKIDYKNGVLSISVKDEGIGIDKEYQNRIFDAFSQADSSTTRKYGGTGLGLSISYNLVKIMNGKLQLKSEVGLGSEFFFSLPLKIGKKIKKDISTNNNKIFNGRQVLLTEDNKANQLFMKVLLKKMGLKFDIANDGVEAVRIYKENNYDAVLMDENMPNMSGIEATKKILEYERQNSLKHTPVIALTANALKGDRERFLKAGMDEYLTKPLDKHKLAEVLRELLK